MLENVLKMLEDISSVLDFDCGKSVLTLDLN